MSTVVNYNRSLLTNTGFSISIPFGPAPVLLAEFGLFVPPGVDLSNFVELDATIGWSLDSTIIPDGQPDVQFIIQQDGIPVASTFEEAITDANSGDFPLLMTTTFKGILTNVSTGHHVYRLFAVNTFDFQGATSVRGPVTFSGTLIS